MDNLIEQNVTHTTRLTTTTGPVAQWIRPLTTNQGIPASSTGRVDILLHIIALIISMNNISHIRLELHLPTGPVAQWIRHLTTNQGIPGSSPGRVNISLHILV